MENINDLQIGKAGEYLVCADLILNGFVAFLSEQGLPFDVVLNYNGRLFKVQVKTTRRPREVPQRKTSIPAYIFNIGRNGNNNRHNCYCDTQVDLFALVALDTRQIAYLLNSEVATTMLFRVPSCRGKYHDEQGTKKKRDVLELKSQGLSCSEIAQKLNMKLSNVYRYSANVSIEQKGTNAGMYFDELTLKRCLSKLTQIT